MLLNSVLANNNGTNSAFFGWVHATAEN